MRERDFWKKSTSQKLTERHVLIWISGLATPPRIGVEQQFVKQQIFIDSRILFHVFLFLRPVHRDVVKLIIKWVVFFFDHVSNFFFLMWTRCHRFFSFLSLPTFTETPQHNTRHGYDTEQHPVVRLQFWSSGECWLSLCYNYSQVHSESKR